VYRNDAPSLFTLCGVGGSPTYSFAYIDRSHPQISLSTSYLYDWFRYDCRHRNSYL